MVHGGGTAVGWWLIGVAEARRCSNGEGGGPAAQEAALLHGNNSRPAHRKGGTVRSYVQGER
jgi:hypothetical protein